MSKLCSKCGGVIGEEEKFCRKCGTPVTAVNGDSYLPKNDKLPSNVPKKRELLKKKELSNKKAIMVLLPVTFVLVILLITTFALYFLGSARESYNELKNGNYVEAEAIYNADVKDSFIQKLFADSKFKKYAEKTANDFTDGKINYETASSILYSIKNMGLEEVSSIIDEMNKTYTVNTAYGKASTYYESGDYENAIKEFSKIPADNEKYGDAQSKLNEMYPKYIESIVNKANELVAVGSSKEALSIISVAINILPKQGVDISALQTAKTNALNDYKERTLAEITALISANKFEEAITLANEAVAFDNNEEFRKAKLTAEAKYVENVTATVNKFLSEGDYISAKRNVETALTVLPNNASLKALKTKVEKDTPTYLLDVCKPYFTDGDYKEYINGEEFSIGGTRFTNGFSVNNCGGTAIFNLDSKYSMLNFHVGHVDDSSDFESGGVSVKIYLDGILQKELQTSCESLAQNVMINVTGVEQVKIVVQFINDGYVENYYGFGNVTVK